MKHFDWKHGFAAIAATALICIALLWSWNTVAELFGAPAADLRHAVAILVLAWIARALVTRRGGLR